MLGWSPAEPLHLKETLEETLARELKQVDKNICKTKYELIDKVSE